MSKYMLPLALLMALLACLPALADDVVPWDGPGPERTPGPGETIITFNKYDDSFAWDALEALSGERPAEDSSRSQMGALTLELLNTLETYGQRETAELRPPIPQWFLDGYNSFHPANLQRSRYLTGVEAGTYPPHADIAALYAHWCAYDAEWFGVVRNPDYKAWLSAVLLTYAPTWPKLKGEATADLHDRLVTPLQTRDEPLRELDNWIENFSDSEEAFVKPLVLSALSGELVERGGLNADGRFVDGSAYDAPAPSHLGLSDEHFALLGALTITYFREIYELEPTTKQPLYFRDYFLERFYALN